MKTAYEESDDNRMKFNDYGDRWEPGATVSEVSVETSQGKDVFVGRIVADVDMNNGMRTFRSYDCNGKEITSPNYSLYQVKKHFKRHEQELFNEAERQAPKDLHPQAPARTFPEMQEELQPAPAKRIIKRKNKSKSRTR